MFVTREVPASFLGPADGGAGWVDGGVQTLGELDNRAYDQLSVLWRAGVRYRLRALR